MASLACLDAFEQRGQLANDVDAQRLLGILLGDDQVAIGNVMRCHLSALAGRWRSGRLDLLCSAAALSHAQACSSDALAGYISGQNQTSLDVQ